MIGVGIIRLPAALILMAAMSLVFASTAAAQSNAAVVVLTVDEAVERAVRENLNLRREALTLAQQEREAESAWNRFYPSIDATGTLSRQNNPPPTSSDPWSAAAGISSSLTLSAPLLQEGRRTANRYAQGLLTYERARQTLRRDVQKAFFSLLVRERNIELKRENVETARIRFERSMVEYESGRVSRFSMLSNQVAYERQIPELANLEDAYREELAGFALLLGYPRGTVVRPAGDISVSIPTLDSEALIARFVAGRPDVRQAELQRAADQLARAVEQNRLAPSLTMSYSVTQSNQAPFTAPWFDGEDRWNLGGQLQFQVRVPLSPHLPSSSSRVTRANQDVEIEKRTIALSQVIAAAETEIEQLVRRIQRGVATLDVVRLNEALARTAFELAEVEFDRGLIDSLELRNAQLSLEQTQIDVLEEEFRIASALIDLEFALNAQF